MLLSPPLPPLSSMVWVGKDDFPLNSFECDVACWLASTWVVPACRVARVTSLPCLDCLRSLANTLGTYSQAHLMAMSLIDSVVVQCNYCISVLNIFCPISLHFPCLPLVSSSVTHSKIQVKLFHLLLLFYRNNTPATRSLPWLHSREQTHSGRWYLDYVISMYLIYTIYLWLVLSFRGHAFLSKFNCFASFFLFVATNWKHLNFLMIDCLSILSSRWQ